MFMNRINYDEDGDYNMENHIIETIPKSILKTGTTHCSNKQVSFNEEALVVHYYLSPEERMDKSLHYQSVNNKKNYYY